MRKTNIIVYKELNRDAHIENSQFWWWQLRSDNINIEFTITKSSQDQFFLITCSSKCTKDVFYY